MSAIDQTATLGALVAERAGRAPLFGRLRLDYCCSGAQTLSEACRERGLDVGTVSTVIEALDVDGAGERAESLSQQTSEESDWRQSTIEGLCAHIVAVHHARLRGELYRIDRLLAKTVHAHLASHPALGEMRRAFDAIRAELEPHLDREEEVLFPRCIALERVGLPIEDALIEYHADEHRDVGERLAALRTLGGEYDTGQAVCATHRTLLEALRAFELGMRQHIHEENNVLLVRARELNEEARAARAAQQSRFRVAQQGSGVR
jgi:regulator of cell morphogenesis and NO signaling